MGDSGLSSEDQNVDCKGQAHEVSVGNESSIGNWTKDPACYMARNLFTFCPGPELFRKLRLRAAD